MDLYFFQITIEPPQGLRANLLVAYKSLPITDDKYYNLSYEHEEIQIEFQRLVYGICFFHGVVVERHRYGPVGWNNSRYGFNVSDLNISLAQMKQVLMQVWES